MSDPKSFTEKHMDKLTQPIYGTPTGRLSTSQPEMQELPGPRGINESFMEEPLSLAEIDYAQAELRIMAFLSGEDIND